MSAVNRVYPIEYAHSFVLFGYGYTCIAVIVLMCFILVLQCCFTGIGAIIAPVQVK